MLQLGYGQVIKIYRTAYFLCNSASPPRLRHNATPRFLKNITLFLLISPAWHKWYSYFMTAENCMLRICSKHHHVSRHYQLPYIKSFLSKFSDFSFNSRLVISSNIAFRYSVSGLLYISIRWHRFWYYRTFSFSSIIIVRNDASSQMSWIPHIG